MDGMITFLKNMNSRRALKPGVYAYRRSGFSLIEMMVVIVLGGIIAGFVVRSFGTLNKSTAVRAAGEAFIVLHSRARVHAVERGTNVRLVVDTAGDSAYIERAGVNVETLAFRDDMDVSVSARSATVTLCMNPRGYANSACNSFGDSISIVFSNDTKSRSVLLRSFGQAELR